MGTAQTSERDLPVTVDSGAGEALTGAVLGRWCYENPNLAARTIEGLRRKDVDLSERLMTHDRNI